MVRMSIPVDQSVQDSNLSFDFYFALAEIQKQGYIGLCGNQVIHELDFVSLRDPSYRFEFYDDNVLDDQVGHKLANDFAFIQYGNRLLRIGFQSAPFSALSPCTFRRPIRENQMPFCCRHDR